MVADYAQPTVASLYTDVLTQVKDRDVAAITLDFTDPSNIPENAMKWNRATNLFQERIGGVWVDKVLAVAGGGTGGNTAVAARTALGIGTMGTQAANAVAITGGTIAGVTGLSVHCSILPDTHNAYDLGSSAARFRKAYFGSALVAPSGADKYTTS